MKLIITADDYGMCGIVDVAIDACVAAGLCTSTNVIVNMEDFNAAYSLRSRFPNLSIGMHWNVTSGHPISSPESIPSLVDDNGCFFKVSEFIKLYRAGVIKKADIKTELIAQYNLFKEACGSADYWNTHQNSSLDFKTFDVFAETARELGIDKTRTFKRIYPKDKRLPGGIKGVLVEFVKKIVLDVWFGVLIPRKWGNSIKMTDGRVVYWDNNQKSEDVRNICENVRWEGKKTAELVIHPSTDAHHKFFGTITEPRVKEYQMFTNPLTKEHLEKNGIEICNFDILE